MVNLPIHPMFAAVQCFSSQLASAILTVTIEAEQDRPALLNFEKNDDQP